MPQTEQTQNSFHIKHGFPRWGFDTEIVPFVHAVLSVCFYWYDISDFWACFVLVFLEGGKRERVKTGTSYFPNTCTSSIDLYTNHPCDILWKDSSHVWVLSYPSVTNLVTRNKKKCIFIFWSGVAFSSFLLNFNTASFSSRSKNESKTTWPLPFLHQLLCCLCPWYPSTQAPSVLEEWV